MLEWRRLAANRKLRRMAASMPNTAPVVHFIPSRSRYQFLLLGEQRHKCVNNLPRVAPKRRNSRESNSQPFDHESDALPLHHQATPRAPKIRGKYFSGNYYVKFWQFFSCKIHVKFGNFVNFSGKYHKNSGIFQTYFSNKNVLLLKLTELLRL